MSPEHDFWGRQLDNDLIKQMYVDQELPIDRIANHLGVSSKPIHRILKQMGVEMRPTGPVPSAGGSDLRNKHKMRTRNITGRGNVGGAHQQFSGAPTAGSKNIPRT
jgi:uncharacterized protein YjcR